MESRKMVQAFGIAFCFLILVSEILSSPSYTPEDYEQAGIREMLEELERQGLTGPVVPRAYKGSNPNHAMMRKSQRSNSLRLRFGKRSSNVPDVPILWKTMDEENKED